MRNGRLQEILEAPEAFRILLALDDHGPFTMKQFSAHAGRSDPHARALRNELARLGYVTIHEKGGHGRRPEMSIALTPSGHDLVRLLREIRTLHATALARAALETQGAPEG